MKASLRHLYILLFILGIFFIPFNSFEGVKELGEFKRESGAYFMFVGFFVVVAEWIRKKRALFPYRSYAFHILLLFLFWCCLSTFLNGFEVSDSFYKKTTGFNRFLRQMFSLILSCLFFFALYWNVIVKMKIGQAFFLVRRIFLYSFIVVTIYGFLEICYINTGFYPAYTLLRLFDYFPFTEYDSDIAGRISSVAYEPPFLAIYLITVAGWMFSYILTHTGIARFLPTIAIIILTYFSGSRTALIVVLLQCILFFWIYLNNRQKIIAMSAAALLALASIMVVALTNSDKIVYDVNKKMESLDFKGNLKKNNSNKSRFGIQYANLIVFSEHPLVGVGFGQQGFYARYYYPLWAQKDNWEFKSMYLNKNNPMFPPGYNLYIRLLAETGVIGFLIFSFFLYFLVSRSRQMIRSSRNHLEKAMAIVLYISFVGYMLNWLQVDTFRMYGFWLCLSLFIAMSETIHTKKSFPTT